MNTTATNLTTANLRDQFAMTALSGILATYSGEDAGFPGAAYAAQTAYAYANAMMKEREKPWSPED